MLFISKEACSFSRLEGNTRNTVLRRQVRPQGANSCYQRQITSYTLRHCTVKFHLQSSWSLVELHLLQCYSSTYLLNTTKTPTVRLRPFKASSPHKILCQHPSHTDFQPLVAFSLPRIPTDSYHLTPSL